VIREILRRSGVDCDVLGILCFTHPDVPAEGRIPGGVAVRTEDLLAAIRSHRGCRELSPADVRAVAAAFRRHFL